MLMGVAEELCTALEGSGRTEPLPRASRAPARTHSRRKGGYEGGCVVVWLHNNISHIGDDDGHTWCKWC